jgi:hypothetical protein
LLLPRREKLKWPDEQDVALSASGKMDEIFYWLPIEELIRNRQQAYYHALGQAHREADSAAFVELMLNITFRYVKRNDCGRRNSKFQNTKTSAK